MERGCPEHGLLSRAFSRRYSAAASAGSVPPPGIAALPFPRQILEAAGLEQRLVELSTLKLAHLREWRISDDLLDAAAELGARQAELGARHLAEVNRAGRMSQENVGIELSLRQLPRSAVVRP